MKLHPSHVLLQQQAALGHYYYIVIDNSTHMAGALALTSTTGLSILGHTWSPMEKP